MVLTPTEAAALIMAFVALCGMGVQWWQNRRDDKRANTEYWQGVAGDLRKDIEKIKRDAVDARAENTRSWERATKAFDYLCRRVMKADPAGVEIAQGVWEGRIVLVEGDEANP